MKNLFCVPLVLLGLLVALGCRAASPAFKDFDGTQFGTNGDKVRIKEGVIETNVWARESFKFGQTLAGKTNLLITPLGTGVILWADGVPVLSIQPGGLTPGTNILSAVLVGGGGTNNVLTNAVLKILQASDGTGIIGVTLNNGMIWSASTNGVTTEGTLFGLSPSFVVNYTNVLALAAMFHSGLSAWTNGLAGQGTTNFPNGDITAGGDVRVGGTIFAVGIDATGEITTTDNISGNTIIGTVLGFIGNGAGITNLSAAAAIAVTYINNITNNNLTVTNNAFFNFLTVTNNATFNGKVTLNSNVYVLNLTWVTNLASTLTLNVGKTLQRLSTNNNVNITGFTGMDGTNGNTFSLIFTNTAGSAAVKTLDLPAGTLVLSSPYSRTIYNTNQGVLSGIVDPLFGTNVTWVGF